MNTSQKTNSAISIILIFLLLVIGAVYLDNDTKTGPQSNASVNISDVSCVDYRNNTACWTQENKSEVNLSKLTDR